MGYKICWTSGNNLFLQRSFHFHKQTIKIEIESLQYFIILSHILLSSKKIAASCYLVKTFVVSGGIQTHTHVSCLKYTYFSIRMLLP